MMPVAQELANTMAVELANSIDDEIIYNIRKEHSMATFYDLMKVLMTKGYEEVGTYTPGQYEKVGPSITRLYPEFALLDYDNIGNKTAKKMINQCDLRSGGIVLTSSFMSSLFVIRKQADKAKMMIKLAESNNE